MGQKAWPMRKPPLPFAHVSSKSGIYKMGHGAVVYQNKALPLPIPLVVSLKFWIIFHSFTDNKKRSSINQIKVSSGAQSSMK